MHGAAHYFERAGGWERKNVLGGARAVGGASLAFKHALGRDDASSASSLGLWLAPRVQSTTGMGATDDTQSVAMFGNFFEFYFWGGFPSTRNPFWNSPEVICISLLENSQKFESTDSRGF